MALSRTSTEESKKLGRYEPVRELMASSVGSTSTAQAAGETREYLVTRIHKHMAKAAPMVESLLARAQETKGFAHDNVVPLVDAGIAEGEPYVVYESGGETLASILRATGPEGLPLPVALRISLDMLEGFSAAHGRDPPLGHGEVGPWCIHVGVDGVSRVCGFGVDQAIWKFGAHYVKNLERLSYAAPERVRAMSSTIGQELSVADEQSDLFSAAAIVFELVTKQRLFASKMEAAVVQKVLTAAIPTAASVRPEVGAEISNALKGALARDRGERMKTFDDLIQALEAAVSPDLIASPDVVAELVQLAHANALKLGPEKRSIPPAPRGTAPFGGRSISLPKAPGVPVIGGASALASSAGSGSAAVAGNGPAVRAPIRGGPTAPGIGPAPTNGGSAGTPAPAAASSASPSEGPASSPFAGRSKSKTIMGFAPPTPAAATPAAATPAAATPAPSPAAATAPKLPPKPPTRSTPAMPAVKITEARSSAVEISDADLLSEETGDQSAHAPPPASDNPPASSAKPNRDTQITGTPLLQSPRRPRPRAATLMGLNAPDEIIAPPAGGADAKDDKAKPGTEPLIAPLAAGSANAPAQTKGVLKPSKKGAYADRVHPGAILEAQGASYEMIAPLARGGMAVVWAAREIDAAGDPVATDDALGKVVAIKTMLPELYDDEDFEHMFLDESRVAAKIQHENVAKILALGTTDDLLYIVMEWVDGETLSTIQQAARDAGLSFPNAVLLRIAAETAAGLHAAHELKDDAGHSLDLVHRDMSPANVLISRTGVVKIVDFGIAKSKGRLHVTRASGMVKGKTPYLSPEQIGGLGIDRRSDLFSLGVLLYVLATGKHPFRDETEIQTLENIAINAPIPPSQVSPEVDPGLERIILKLLQKDPRQRYATAAEVEAAVREEEATLAAPPTNAEVAAFVEKAVGEKLAERRKMLAANLPARETPGRAKSNPFGEDATIDESKAKSPQAGGAANGAAAPAGEDAPLDLGAIEIPVPGKLPDLGSPNPEAERDPPAVAESASASDAAEPSFAAMADEEAVDVPPSGDAMRLVKLIALGVLVGLVVIGAIELIRRTVAEPTAPSATSTASSSVAPPRPTVSTPAAQTTAPTAPPPPSTEPSTTASSAPTEAPSATAAPSAAPTAAPTGAPLKPPPYNGNKRPPPYKPPPFNPNTL